MDFSHNMYMSIHMVRMRQVDPRTCSFLDTGKGMIVIIYLWKLKDELSLFAKTVYNVFIPLKISKQ